MAGRPPLKEAPDFGKRLAALRKHQKWTQNELAERLGTTVKMVTYYEREAENPTHKTIEAIAKVFGMSAAALMGQTTDQTTDQTSGKTTGSKPGPPSQIEERLPAIRELPREKQKEVLQFMDYILQTTPPAKTNGAKAKGVKANGH